MPDCNRTPILKPLVDQLIGYNDEFCYSLFAESEVGRLLARLGPNANKLFSTDAFSDNPHASKIHVTIQELREFQTTHRLFSFGAYFSASYEVFSTYYEPALSLLTECATNTLVPRNTNKLERTFEGTLIDSGLTAPPPSVIDTIEYIRIRRNALIHQHSIPTQGYSNFVAAHGIAMNTYWGATRGLLDLSIATVEPPNESDTIVLMKLLRISAEVLDSIVAENLDSAKVLRKVAASTRASLGKINADVLRNAVGPLRAALNLQYGLRVTDTDALAALQ